MYKPAANSIRLLPRVTENRGAGHFLLVSRHPTLSDTLFLSFLYDREAFGRPSKLYTWHPFQLTHRHPSPFGPAGGVPVQSFILHLEALIYIVFLALILIPYLSLLDTDWHCLHPTERQIFRHPLPLCWSSSPQWTSFFSPV